MRLKAQDAADGPGCGGWAAMLRMGHTPADGPGCGGGTRLLQVDKAEAAADGSGASLLSSASPV